MNILELSSPFLDPMSNLEKINKVLEEGYQKDKMRVKIPETMSRSATICAWSGNFDLAIEKATKINRWKKCKVSSYCEIAKALIVAGHTERAVSILEEILGVISENGRLFCAVETGPSSSSSSSKESTVFKKIEDSDIDNFLKIAKVWSKIDPQKSLSICSEIEPRIRSQSSEPVHFVKKMALLCSRINLGTALVYAEQLDEVEKLRVILQIGTKICKMTGGKSVAKKLVSDELKKWRAKQPTVDGKSFATLMKGEGGLKPLDVVLIGLNDKHLSLSSVVPNKVKDALGLFQYQIGDTRNARANIRKYIKDVINGSEKEPLRYTHEKLRRLSKKWVKFDYQLSYVLSLSLPALIHEKALKSILKIALKSDSFSDVVSILSKNTSHSITAETIADLTICGLKWEHKAKYASPIK